MGKILVRKRGKNCTCRLNQEWKKEERTERWESKCHCLSFSSFSIPISISLSISLLSQREERTWFWVFLFPSKIKDRVCLESKKCFLFSLYVSFLQFFSMNLWGWHWENTIIFLSFWVFGFLLNDWCVCGLWTDDRGPWTVDSAAPSFCCVLQTPKVSIFFLFFPSKITILLRKRCFF